MTLEEAGSRYAQLRAQLQAGQMDYADFQAEAAKLTALDNSGNWWQIDPASGEWLFWNGTAWVRPAPPEGAAAAAAAPRRQYSLLLQTQDYRTLLNAGGEDGIWVYASVSCSDAAVDCAAFATSIQFHTGGANPRWLTLGPPAPIGGTLAVRATAIAPGATTQLAPGGAAVVATATIEGQTVSAETVLEILWTPPAPAVQYQLAPLLWVYQDNPNVRSFRRAYKGLELEECELVADGEDRLDVALIFARTDLVREGVDPSSYLGVAADFVRIRRAELTGEGSSEFELRLTPVAGGVHQLRIQSRRPLLASADAAPVNLALVVEGEVPESAAAQYPQGQIASHVPLHPKLLFLKLLVVPGAGQGTSEAWAYVGAAEAASTPLAGVACTLDLVSLGHGPRLSLRGDAARRTNQDGLVSWTFDYRGLDWNMLSEARFRVRAAIGGTNGMTSDATWVEIDAGGNIRSFLAELAAAAGQLELNNPAFRPRGDIVDRMWPSSLAGPLNDVCSLVDGSGSWCRYTAREIRDRIWNFALARRYSSDLAVASVMNGLDFGKYETPPVHVCFGLYPAGNADPRFFDPWWDQAVAAGADPLDRAAQAERLSATATLLAAVGPAVLMKMGMNGTAASFLAAIKGWLAGGHAPAGERWMNENGSYAETPAGWGESFFRGAGGENLKSGQVEPLESW